MSHGRVIGIDTAKYSFELHGADASGDTVFNNTPTREKMLPFLSSQAPCTVGLEYRDGSLARGRTKWVTGHDAN
ncbi:MAG: hypothetical protein OXG05_10445 [Gammaproteobacteria bacterium]|nr:hypothetical protein [Gammaproteobacteria bacterium]